MRILRCVVSEAYAYQCPDDTRGSHDLERVAQARVGHLADRGLGSAPHAHHISIAPSFSWKGKRMIRVVVFALALVATLYLLVRLAGELRRGNVDWKGVALAAGFVMLALYLRRITEIGGFV